MHYPELDDIQLGLWLNNGFASTANKICSLVYSKFPKKGLLLVQELETTFGHKS